MCVKKLNKWCFSFLFFSFEDCVTSSFIPIKPFNDIKEHQPTVEVEEFVQESTKYSRPYRVYKNQIYIYPKHLKYDSQKYFSKVQYMMINSGQHWVDMYSTSCLIGMKERKMAMQSTFFFVVFAVIKRWYNFNEITCRLILSFISAS